MTNPLRNKAFGEAVRFGIVGVVATVAHYGIYLLLLPLMDGSVAYTIGYLLSLALNYYLSSRFTFRRKRDVRNGIGFIVSHVVNYTLHITLLNVFIGVGIGERLAPIPVYCVAVPVNFLLVRTVFRKL